MNEILLKYLLILAGVVQIGLVFGSLAIPRLLNWKEHLSKINVLIKQIFWTYAGYILVINFSFGLLSVFGAAELSDGSFLAKVVTLFIAIYWISRILIQFFYFDTSAAPKGFIYKFGEMVLVLVFVFLAFVYAWAFILNMAR
jgi:hypothetical protein